MERLGRLAVFHGLFDRHLSGEPSGAGRGIYGEREIRANKEGKSKQMTSNLALNERLVRQTFLLGPKSIPQEPERTGASDSASQLAASVTETLSHSGSVEQIDDESPEARIRTFQDPWRYAADQFVESLLNPLP